MQKIILISRFEGKKKGANLFHFIGYFNGIRVKKVKVIGGDFEKGEEYLIGLENCYTEESILIGHLAKYKKIFI